MTRHTIYLLPMLAAGCGPGVSSHPGAPADSAIADGSAPTDAPLETQPLGMNDITMMFGLSLGGGNGPPIAKLNGIGNIVRDLVPRALFSRLVTSHNDILDAFEDFNLLALRFDLCDRITPDPCPDGADASLRLVFQPEPPGGPVPDVGLHVFYSIPAAELPTVINELRGIARVRHTPITDPLELALALFETPPAIPALLAKYATADRLIRMAVMGQDQRSSVPRVVFRAIELHDGAMVDIIVPTVDAAQQEVTVAGTDPSYGLTPLADSPTGIALTLTSSAFNAATPAAQRSALEALAATENPLLNTSATAQCASCHVSTYLGAHRGRAAGIDPRTLANRFPTTRDVRVSQGDSATNSRSLHNFSWVFNRDSVFTEIAISQRVANETANVLDEIERRFPTPQSPSTDLRAR